ncbi:hypothetical protein PETEYPAB_85 [Corynebacterium phage PeteyPab]|uniref:Uncharacterized protein n=1 Tax=Corynebacterium phage PeteyPab TaxID=2483663 RepID=A0A3G3MA65_9CAUD|nr:hypothetical protein PETEYPAB_85 [Corynebacterium phage PeteyPab]
MEVLDMSNSNLLLRRDCRHYRHVNLGSLRGGYFVAAAEVDSAPIVRP